MRFFHSTFSESSDIALGALRPASWSVVSFPGRPGNSSWRVGRLGVRFGVDPVGGRCKWSVRGFGTRDGAPPVKKPQL